MTINYDTYVQDTVDAMGKAHDDKQREKLEGDFDSIADLPDNRNPAKKWIDRLPRNIGAGLFRASLNMVDTV